VTGRQFVIAEITTPLGAMTAVATDAGLAVLEFADGPRADGQLRRLLRARPTDVGHERIPVIAKTQRALDAYFAGDPEPFGLPLDPLGTPFQLRCWAWLRAIPSGQTRTYREAALDLGSGPRAFAAANAANPLAIVVPCHRVIGSDGGLHGYGGGVDRKRALLDLESRVSRG
jgi:O-6-methylguanine DNA methyltransferase